MPTALSLSSGQPQVLPDTATAAWGARMIVTQTGDVDFLPDRADRAGDPDGWPVLEERCSLRVVKSIIADLLRSGLMQTRQGADIILYQDELVTVHANTNGSYGYCYVTAWVG
jgi:hypothetical protein